MKLLAGKATNRETDATIVSILRVEACRIEVEVVRIGDRVETTRPVVAE